MRVLVTGGGGFLGQAIVKLLLERGDEVRSFSRNRYPQLDDLGVEQICGNLDDSSAVNDAVNGCDIVYHVAAKAGVWGSCQDFYQTNVVGTRNIVNACRNDSATKLVYTSSPSVVFDGNDMEGVDESVPYPEHFHAWYPLTKAEAEQIVLGANDDTLATVALRPHLIWGPEDNHLVPRILERGQAGALRRIGRRDCLVDTVYIDNAAKAHLQPLMFLISGRGSRAELILFLIMSHCRFGTSSMEFLPLPTFHLCINRYHRVSPLLSAGFLRRSIPSSDFQVNHE